VVVRGWSIISSVCSFSNKKKNSSSC